MTAFTPANAFEQSLLDAQQGKLSQVDFFNQLATAKVVVLLEKEPPASGEWDNSNSPLILNSHNGFPVLALFSSLERATPSAEHASIHKIALEVDLRWILRGAQPAIGLVMNPGSPVGFELPPDGLVELKQALGVSTSPIS